MGIFTIVWKPIIFIFHVIGNTATPITHTHLPHDILKFHIPHLCGVIANPDKLVNDPSLVTLIPDTVKDTLLNNLTLSRYQKASTLLDAIHHNLEECSDPQILKSFCYILKVQDDSALDGIANTMLKQLG